MSDYAIYLHIPFCRSRCRYCGFLSCCDFSGEEAYFERLWEEIERSPATGDCVSVFFGGGTPSAVDPERIARTVKRLNRKIPLKADAELTIECNPDSFDAARATAYRAAGINRVSLGVQTFSDPLLKRIGRRHDGAAAVRAVSLAREIFGNINADLMLGLPGQTFGDVRADLEKIRALGVPHVSAYGLKVEAGTPLAEEGFAPDEDFAADCYDLVWAELGAAGLSRYEVSNFAKPGYECRHNLCYWRRKDYLGFGAGAHSCVGNLRFSNGDLETYFSPNFGREEQRLGEAEEEYEWIMLALRTREGLDRKAFEKRFACDFSEKYRKAIGECGKFLEVSETRVRVSEDGFYLLNALLVKFLF